MPSRATPQLPLLTPLGWLWLLLISIPAIATENYVALSFDDLPLVRIEHFSDAEVTQRFQHLLDALTSTGIPAIGFVNEKRLYRQGELHRQRLALLEAWLDAGHELGNHTYSHLSLNAATAESFEADILRGERITRPLAEKHGHTLRYFRYPYLHVGTDAPTRKRIESFLTTHHYRNAPVTLSGDEWLFAAAYDNALREGSTAAARRIGQAYLEHMEALFEHGEKMAYQLFGRNIRHVLLLHANTLNADYLVALVDRLKKRGYRFITLDAALEDRAYRAHDSYTEPEGDSWLHHWQLSVGLRPEELPHAPKFVQRWAGSATY